MSQVAELSSQWEWVQVFENKGAPSWKRSTPPHGQLWGSDFLPSRDSPRKSSTSAPGWPSSRPLLLDYVERELQDRSRIVVETALAGGGGCPSGRPLARSETCCCPRPMCPQCWISPGSSKRPGGGAQGLTSRYDQPVRLQLPYSMGWHFAPPNSDCQAAAVAAPASARPAALRHRAQSS